MTGSDPLSTAFAAADGKAAQADAAITAAMTRSPWEQTRTAMTAHTDSRISPPRENTQLALGGLGPEPGDRYRNKATGSIAAVLSVTPRNRTWVTVRIMGEEQTLNFATFERQFERI